MNYSPRNFREIAREEVAKQEQSDFLVMVSGVFNYLCDNAMTNYGDEEEQKKAREFGGEIRANALENLAELLERFEANAVLNGMKVLWADDGEEACKMVGQIIEKHEVEVITKGKSMISEEIELNHYIETKTKAKVYEGDLGEFIIQQRGTPPFHIVGPAINLKLNEIVDLLHESIDMPKTDDANEIANYVRDFLRTKFQRADMGITGVNQAIASTGSLLLVENEGNIRWSTSSPRIHVALMSIEKVCDNLADAFYLTDLLTRNCTGQAITSYLSIINGPRKDKEKDGPEEVYVIIIDNGRSKAYLNEEFRKALQCIRCGRCSIKCPVYLRIGAYPYGNCYPGPMGVVLMPLLLGLNETKHLYQACTLCGACMEVCPARVPHVDLYEKYRQMKATGDGDYKASVNIWNKVFFQSFARWMSRRSFYERGLLAARTFLKANSTEGYVKNVPGPMNGWFISRDFPELPSQTFRKYWEEEGSKIAKEGKKDE